MSRMLQDQITRLRTEAQACREVASRISLRTAAQALLETAKAFDLQAEMLERSRDKQQTRVEVTA